MDNDVANMGNGTAAGLIRGAMNTIRTLYTDSAAPAKVHRNTHSLVGIA